MTIQTDVSTSPYFDDYSVEKDFYRIMFQPGVAVQTRELNQLQSIIQNQIEKFGDNILKRGTVVEGCGVSFWEKMPYVKIKDLSTDGTPVNINQLGGLLVKNSSNLVGKIIITEDGLESSPPNLKTLYVNYTNSGISGEETQFQPDQVLTVYDESNTIFKVNVTNGSSGFSNSDVIVVSPTIALQNNTGGKSISVAGRPIQANDIIKSDSGATLRILEVDSTSDPSSLIVKIKPQPLDLRNGDSRLWTLSSGSSVQVLEPNGINQSSGNRVVNTFGSGGRLSLLTDSLGKITSVSVIRGGAGYTYQPTLSISSKTASQNEIGLFEATAQTFLTNIRVASIATSPVGFGYGMQVDSGVIYQKGYFLRVSPQALIVEKYKNTDFDKAVGFFTEEEIINSNVDTSLLDNALGSRNFSAPGADRLKLIPRLRVIDVNAADQETDFYPLVQFSGGLPFSKNNKTQYSVIGDMIAERTFEESGNYVIDQFSLVTRDSANTALTGTKFNIHIDPGTAYINGYRVKTDTNAIISVDKGIDYVSRENTSSILYYGDYLRVNELGGSFDVSRGVLVDLYDTPARFVSTSTLGSNTITPVGSKIGTAIVRSIILESGYAGTSEAVYRLYTFDRNFIPGKSASDVKSIFQSGSSQAICDTIQENGITQVYDKDNTGLLFKIGTAVRTAANTSYYVKEVNPYNMAANGSLIINVSDPLTETLDQFSENTVAENEILVVPQENFQTAQELPGTVTITSGSNILTGTSTQFISNLSIGDTVKIANNASHVYQIRSISNNTTAILTRNASASLGASAIRRYFPKNIPISLSTPNSSRTAKVESNQLLINLGLPSGFTLANDSLNASTPSVLVSFNVKKRFSTSVQKTPRRDAVVRLRLANTQSTSQGPWALGVSDAFRLKSVHKANGAVQIVTFSTNANSIGAGGFINFPNHPFSNNDVIVYNTGSSSALSGLVNAASYIVTNANTSGFNVSNTTSIIAVPTDFQNATQSFSGVPLYFTQNTNGVEEVTNDFVIDNNQTVEQLNTSYLMKKVGVNLSDNDILLVKFDYFETNGEGPKTVSSYNVNDSFSLETITAGSVSTYEIPELYDNRSDKHFDLRDCLDIRPVSAATISYTQNPTLAPINPIEPIYGSAALTSFNAATQVNASTETITITNNPYSVGDIVKYFTGTGTTGILPNNSVYYVKTVSGNDITLSSFESGVNGATVNISTGTGTAHNFERTLLKFSQSKKFFPVPNSVASFDYSNYLGRTDRVVIGTDSKFRVIKGTPGNVSSIPPESSDGMTIDVIQIPPYPSIPQILSQDTARLIDTKIVSQKDLKRRNSYKINTILDSTAKSAIQTRPYRMRDIARLERRIDNLEYYVTLSLQEALTKSRFIPSNINRSLDRFKYGIFVDTFGDYSLSDTVHQEYRANVVNDFLTPSTQEVNLKFTFDDASEGVISDTLAGFDYQEYTLISQLESTVEDEEIAPIPDVDLVPSTPLPDTVVGPIVLPPTEIVGEVEETVVTQILSSAYGQHRNGATGGLSRDVFDDWTYTFSSLEGNARIYFNARDQRVQVEVYQGMTPDVAPVNPVASSLNWKQWEPADWAPGGEASGLDTIALPQAGKFDLFPWVEDSFKLSWNHNPANGQYYMIRVFKGKYQSPGGLRKRKSPIGFYAFRLWYPTDQVITRTVRPSNTSRFNYQGIVQSVNPPEFTLTQSMTFGDLVFTNRQFRVGYISDAQKFDIEVSGLKPQTRHKFIFENADRTSSCSQLNFSPVLINTQDLVSDENGNLAFSFFYDAGIDEATSDFEQQNLLAAAIAGRKSFSVENSDGTSGASGTIEMKYYSRVQPVPVGIPVIPPAPVFVQNEFINDFRETQDMMIMEINDLR